MAPPAAVWLPTQPLWTLSSCPVNKGILRTISVTRPDAMVINWLFYCELIVGHAHEAIWQPLLLVLSHWPLPLRSHTQPISLVFPRQIISDCCCCCQHCLLFLRNCLSAALNGLCCCWFKTTKMRNEFSNGNWVFGYRCQSWLFVQFFCNPSVALALLQSRSFPTALGAKQVSEASNRERGRRKDSIALLLLTAAVEDKRITRDRSSAS